MNTMLRSLHHVSALGLALLLAVVASCSDSTAPQQKTTSELHFLAFASNAPAIQDTVVRFFAKLGENREIRLRYVTAPGSTNTEEFLRFEVPGNALAFHPDGTPFAQNDSIQISIRLTDLRHLIFDFQPAGLRFSPDHPARLRIEFAHCDKDLNGDGVEDAQDVSLLGTAGIWKQETPDQPWVRLADVLHFDTQEVDADILGFTGYALAF
jgi:hypothetical protein